MTHCGGPEHTASAAFVFKQNAQNARTDAKAGSKLSVEFQKTDTVRLTGRRADGLDAECFGLDESLHHAVPSRLQKIIVQS